MGQLKARCEFYRSLAMMEGAGVPRGQALQQRHMGVFRRVGRRMGELISSRGITVSEAMSTFPRLFAPFERNLVAVGEQTGRLEVVFSSLADWFDLLQRLRSHLISGLMYPAMQYHAAAVLIPLISMLTGDASLPQAIATILVLLGVPYVLGFLVFVVRPALVPPGTAWPAAVERGILFVPVLGGVIRKMDYTRFFHAYALSLQAGLKVADAVRVSALGCKNAFLRGRFLRVADIVHEQGCSFTEAYVPLLSGGEKGSVAVVLMETGEVAGSPDDMAARIARVYGDEAQTALERAAKVLPVLVYLAIALYIALQIVRFWGRIYGEVNSLL
ncbi:MAG: hypothetical protein A3K19_05830 [Lentisphaerae bacterium RIFOXYB12_FULL_65_16]|nr:MAG: hypothetical protein A3K18_15445 [Lentisphaerae bacterium RIFOXYA12_64_32]OGV95092.1 MAG: hypothetical protein A3K19_05830 [Lentisphaerae bacterium RIFOXYB12_FULL_65_16]